MIKVRLQSEEEADDPLSSQTFRCVNSCSTDSTQMFPIKLSLNSTFVFSAGSAATPYSWALVSCPNVAELPLAHLL